MMHAPEAGCVAVGCWLSFVHFLKPSDSVVEPQHPPWSSIRTMGLCFGSRTAVVRALPLPLPSPPGAARSKRRPSINGARSEVMVPDPWGSRATGLPTSCDGQ